jgi:excisionase family DNA binding protein
MSDLARALLDELAGDPAALERLRELVAPPAPDPSPRLLTVNDAAKILGCSIKTVYRRIDAGEIKAVRDGGRWKIPRDELDRYVARLERPGARRPSKRRATARRRDYAFLSE